jgi:hypothetical protein
MENRWRHWIAKCVIAGNSHDYIIRFLLEKDYAESDIIAEISAAESHPYINGAKELLNRKLARAADIGFYANKSANNQAWLLERYERLARLDPNFGEIQRIDPPPFHDFLERFIAVNRPVILAGCMEDWKPYNTWTFDYFRRHHKDSIVGIQDGRDSDPFYEQNQKFHRKEVRFGDFLDRLERTDSSNDFYMTAGNMGSHRVALSQLFDDAENINIRNEYFEFPAEGSLWIGPKGTVTPLHFDMINNFFCQISGSKRVRLVPSWSMPWVYNDYHVYSDVDAASPDFDQHPLFSNVTMYDFVVYPGEVLFIPLGWWHHLESLEPTVSLTRKRLNHAGSNTYGGGFIQGSKNFILGQGL